MQNPPVMYTMPGTSITIPLPPNLWQYYSREEQAKIVLGIVKGVVLDASLTRDQFLYIGGATVLDPNVDIFRIVGTYGGGEVNEFAGSLFDRMNNPNSWIDKNPDTSVGGDKIHCQTYPGSTYTELSWRKVASPAL